MKNKIILTNLAVIILLGCNTSTNSGVKPTSSPTSSSSTTITTTSIRPEDKYCYQVYCKPINKDDIDNPKLDKPIDLAVSNDGKYVYAINTRLGSDPEGACGNGLRENFTAISRGYIYKITEDKKISVLKINDNYDYSCHNRNLIESDKNNNLYTLKNTFDINSKDGGINTLKQSILKINNSYNVEKELNLKKEEVINYNYRIYQLNVSKLDNNITYDQYPYSSNLELRKTANKINNDGSIDTLYIYPIYGGAGVPPFIFEDNKLNFGGSYIKEPFPYISDPSKGYNSSKRITLIPTEKDLTIKSIRMNSKKEVFVLAYTKNATETNTIYKIVPNKGFEVFAGSTEAGYKDGNGTDARFNNPSSIDFDANDNMYVADTDNNAIRKITPNGDVTTFFKQD